MAQLPWGNAFIVKTPALDQLQNRIYQEQRQRELYQQQQNQMLDNEFSRNLSGIRDADIGDLTNAYGNFKMSYQNMLKQRNGVPPDQQLDVLRKKAAVYDIINSSKQQKDWEKSMGQQIMQDKKGLYADDAHQQLMSRMNTPLSKLNTDNDGNLLYKYSMPDLSNEVKSAKGEPKEVSLTVGQNKLDPFKDDKEIYKVGNSPNQFYSNLLQGVVANNKTRNFTGLVSNKYSDAELADLQNKYDAKINDPKFIAIYGPPQPLPASASNTDLGKAVAIETMENVVNTPLAPVKVSSEVNEGRRLASTQAFQLKKQGIAHQNSLENIKLSAYYNNKDPEAIDKNVDGIIQKHLDNSKSLNGEVPMSPETFKAITGDVLTKNTVVKIDSDGNYTYGKRELDNDGKPTGNVMNERNIPYGEAKTALTKWYKTGLSSKNDSGTTSPVIKFSDPEEKGILNFMKSNKLSRDAAIKILKEHGRLK